MHAKHVCHENDIVKTVCVVTVANQLQCSTAALALSVVNGAMQPLERIGQSYRNTVMKPDYAVSAVGNHV